MAAVQNNSHGCLKGDNLQRLRRFLCLGNDGGTYFVQDILLGAENAQCIINLVNEGMGEEVIEELKRVSEDRSAPKQDTIIFALALCTCLDHLKTKQAAYRALPQICSIPTHLFHFVDCIQKLDINSGGKPRSGHWGRGMRRAINKWYNSKDPKVLAEAVTKYKQRKGWSHTDLLRLAHVKPVNEGKVSDFSFFLHSVFIELYEILPAGHKHLLILNSNVHAKKVIFCKAIKKGY